MKMMKGMSINVSGCVVAHKTMNLSAPRFAGIKRLTVWIDSLSTGRRCEKAQISLPSDKIYCAFTGEFMLPDSSTRLNKYISESGICSRREADRYIEQGNVFLNGKRATIGDQVKPGRRKGKNFVKINVMNGCVRIRNPLMPLISG
jgi:ribosomal 50S subunit-recycling heat shock protein